ncbi:MAG: hypothetical protein Cons2KO_30820 [Congregibacter sp.]
MALWTYRNAFVIDDEAYESVVSIGMQVMTARLMSGGRLIDEQELLFAAGYKNIIHEFATASVKSVRVEVGYLDWRRVGIKVFCDERLLQESHPRKDICYAEKSRFFSAIPTQDPAAAREVRDRWQRNKYSVYADMALGLAFFAVGKLTGDLSLAALIGGGLGLGLVLVQRFVKVDLLGGFAVFGTVMLLISAGFSLAFQSEFMVQMKSTILGVGTALLFFGDGLLRGGAYFGERLQRYMPATIDTSRMAVGLGAAGLLMAALNYGVARFMSEDAWLSYTTFFDTPLSIGLAYAVFFWARKGAHE